MTFEVPSALLTKPHLGPNIPNTLVRVISNKQHPRLAEVKYRSSLKFVFNKYRSTVEMAQFDQEKVEELIDLCDQMLERSYCIYSKFPVAAVLITNCDKIFTGKLI